MHIRNLLMICVTLGPSWVGAQTAVVPAALSVEDARTQRLNAKALKEETEKTYDAEKALCRDATLTIRCMSLAKERRLDTLRQANALEQAARKAERESRLKEVEAKAAIRAAETPEREARQQQDTADFRQKEAQKAAERERKLAEKETQVESRRSKAAAARLAQRNKLDERRKEDADRAKSAPEKAQKRMERQRQHAERARRIDERKQQYADQLKRREADRAAQQGLPSAGAGAR